MTSANAPTESDTSCLSLQSPFP